MTKQPKLSPRMTTVLHRAASHPAGRAYNDGGTNFLRTHEALLKRGYLREIDGNAGVITETGRAAVAHLVEADKDAARDAGRVLGDLAHLGELARSLGWIPEAGQSVHMLGDANPREAVGYVCVGKQHRGHCRTCRRTDASVDVRQGRSITWGVGQCDIAPTAHTLALYVSARADALEAFIDDTPYLDNTDRQDELDRYRALAGELVMGPANTTEPAPATPVGEPEGHDYADKAPGELEAGDVYAPAGYQLDDPTAWAVVESVDEDGDTVRVWHDDDTDAAEFDSAATVYVRRDQVDEAPERPATPQDRKSVWCSVHEDVHKWQPDCRNVETDRAFTKRLMREDRQRDQDAEGVTEARYVAQHRPY